MPTQVWRAFDLSLHVVIATLVLALAGIGVAQVFFRYVLHSSLAWTEEMSRFLLIWLVLLAAAAEVKRGAHISMRVLVDLFKPHWRALVDRIASVLILCFALIMVVYGLQLSERTMSQTATTLPIQMGQVYLALPLSGLIMVINVLRLFWEDWRTATVEPGSTDVAGGAAP